MLFLRRGLCALARIAKYRINHSSGSNCSRRCTSSPSRRRRSGQRTPLRNDVAAGCRTAIFSAVRLSPDDGSPTDTGASFSTAWVTASSKTVLRAAACRATHVSHEPAWPDDLEVCCRPARSSMVSSSTGRLGGEDGRARRSAAILSRVIFQRLVDIPSHWLQVGHA